MPLRDPNAIQLDFPLLTADLIAQLNLIGTVGLLNFDPVVRPVFIVGDRNLSVEVVTPVFTSSQISNGFAAAPAINAIIVDTGPLPAGDYDLFGSISMVGAGATSQHLELQHRNAANAVTLAVLADQVMSGAASEGGVILESMGYRIAEDERLRVQLLGGLFLNAISGVIGHRIRLAP